MASFQQFLSTWPAGRRAAVAAGSAAEDVLTVLGKDTLRPEDFLALLSPAATPYLENMAKRAHELTLRRFGRTVQLFTPLYLSNICTNRCRYCGFSVKNKQRRRHLSVLEASAEARIIAATGLRHILLLTGDARKVSPPEYIADIARAIKPYFASIGVEVYAMNEEEYTLLVLAGIDSMTMFQETYSEELYAWLHPAGPKSDYAFRLAAPERAAKAGLISLGIGALLGLEIFEQDAFATGLHAWWLQKNFPGVEISVSVPRICPHEGDFDVPHPVDDIHFAQYVTALRCFLPRAGITCSTRESAFMRDHLVPLGVTRVSAGVSTAVGGRSTQDNGSQGQFEISDRRSAAEMTAALSNLGYQAVVKDWEAMTEVCPL
ncbi:MAG: 2-iminoacetate synthase ThiH [Desulfovibrio sp.]|jgi:2-iminoacetate synthase|nr:2-iminoacetate synthase ThiH [Desulfovibrio sp.]